MEKRALPAWIILACLGLSYSKCPQGWFGSGCQYKCRCAQKGCKPLDGSCDKCQQGWFGPACQYVDLAPSNAIFARKSPIAMVVDGYEQTCLSANEVTMSFTSPLRLSWFRVHVRESYYMNKLKIQFRHRNNLPLLACENKRTALVSDTALDIHCDLAVDVTQVILTGESVQALCSFYISGGRNVALKQKAAQSSLFDVSRSLPGNAVDGDTTSWFDKATCTHTHHDDKKPDWNVTLSRPAAVNRYVVYNRDEGAHVDERLQGFLLTSFDPAGAEVFRFTDTARNEQEVYTVTSAPTEVQTVGIRPQRKDRSGHIVLTLCEVEVYGDSVCEPGLYGRECEHKCNCADSKDTCFVSTGGCPSGCQPGYQGEDCSQVCDAGWFGTSCQYKCHCPLDLCSPVDGSCTQGSSCASGWFGPGCQYEDLVQSDALDQSLLPPIVIRDGNDNTCVDKITQQVVVAWTKHYHFTWLRAVVKDPYFVSKLSLQFMTDERTKPFNCTKSQQARVSETTMDIHCDMQELVKQVILTGEGVKYLCSLYISGGRNVAIRQRTKQSSLLMSSKAKNAVDGNTDGNVIHGSCTQTLRTDPKQVWTVLLQREILVDRYELYSTDMDTPNGYVLETYNQVGNAKIEWELAFPNERKLTAAGMAFPVSLLNIKLGDSRRPDGHLALCEVEMFGDTVCEPGLYGRECEYKCACANNDTCFVSTGGCPSGCAPGLRGESCGQVCRNGTHDPDCSNSCSQFCRMGDDNTTACDHVHGTCLFGCQPGYSGSRCYEACDTGLYGPGCAQNCPEHCKENELGGAICHHINGTCLQGCQDGYTGPMCDHLCGKGTYGADCGFSCSQFCVKGNISETVCDPVDGSCLLGCLTGYQGPQCDEYCQPGMHGPDCSFDCPRACRGTKDVSLCHHIEGTCLQGCWPGYQGPVCDETCGHGTFGDGCNSSCSEFCKKGDHSDAACDHITGVCPDGCRAGYQGLRCTQACDRGTYGDGCMSACSQFCVDGDVSESVCDRFNGTCLHGCQAGYLGHKCDEPKSNTSIKNNTASERSGASMKDDSSTHSNSRTLWAVFGGIAVAVALVVGVIIWWRYKKFDSFKHRSSSDESLHGFDSTPIIGTELSDVDTAVHHE